MTGSRRLYTACGFSGTGLSWGAVAGKLLAQLVQGAPAQEAEQTALLELLSPSRVTIAASARKFFDENINVAKHFVLDRFARVEPLATLAAGEGAIVRHEGSLAAAYRDESGALYLLSPVCSHAGCHVRWNAAEKTWDCPCHGARYSAQGRRLYGPAPEDLRALKVPK